MRNIGLFDMLSGLIKPVSLLHLCLIGLDLKIKGRDADVNWNETSLQKKYENKL